MAIFISFDALYFIFTGVLKGAAKRCSVWLLAGTSAGDGKHHTFSKHLQLLFYIFDCVNMNI